MVTMQKRNDPSVQTFTLPITSVVAGEAQEEAEQQAKVGIFISSESCQVVDMCRSSDWLYIYHIILHCSRKIVGY